ncbi:hypothetical protein B1C78_02630 [Thioalkalivibrio denitrificans]|uniref:Beta-ketoacyl synthase N-terminal domain-containing protein n=1 Tax=Thioalkalivibrio denitrificans TaxID=108003 RepID=A0A1V3NSE5_9GAMM|nr:hypothetical protein [Thioalkalivibrio denitrificans]OOG27883.1 hypothetical protein B1C78_02630 [Thioalkalivibrio denitrificans]
MPEGQTADAFALAPAGVAITAVGLHCGAGDQPFGLFGVVAAGHSLARADENLTAPLPGDDGDAAVMLARSHLPAMDPDERMFSALALALDGALARWPAPVGEGRKVLVQVLVPGPDSERGSILHTDRWAHRLRTRDAGRESLDVRIAPLRGCATRALLRTLEAWDEEGWDAVIFGAVDSLVDELTCRALARAGRAQTVRSDGVVPGEAACCLVLERKLEDDGSVMAWLDALAVSDEPHAGAPHRHRLEGLGRAMREALGHAKRPLEDLGALVLTLGSDASALLEWYQTESRLWPTELPEAERVAVALGEADAVPAPEPAVPERLNLNLSLGDIGAASLPVALALACARLEFEHPVVDNCMATEAGGSPQRGAVLLRRPHGAQTGARAA